MDKKRFYITTAIDYVNQKPHLGTAYEKIGADCMARYKRLCGYETHFLMGNDEHSTNVEREARKRGMEPLDYCKQMSGEFTDTWKSLNISYDDFIHTTEKRHEKSVSRLFSRIYENGYIYKGKYEGLYCESCEEFVNEKDLVDGLCATHKQKPKSISEDNYFFALSKFEQPLLDHIKKNPGFVRPGTRANEVLNLIKGGLFDVSISRAGVEWGIPLPIDSGHVVYVWFDALTNYISALDYGGDDSSLFDRFWPADFHVIGKDITRFHCVIWPAMLMAAGIELPKSIFAHGFISLAGEKMSKSRGNILDPGKMVSVFGPDSLRYLLLREVPFTKDGDISVDLLVNRYNADLANELGNLFSRTMAMVSKYLGGQIDEASYGPANDLYQEMVSALEGYREHMEKMEFSRALGAYWAIIQRANQYIEEKSPWALAKDDSKKEELKAVFRELLVVLRCSVVVLSPFMPEKMKEMSVQLGGEELSVGDLPPELSAAENIQQPAPLFPRIQGDPEDIFKD